MPAHKINSCAFLIISIMSLFFIASETKAYRPSEQTLTIGNSNQAIPYFWGTLDASGFSDAIYWGYGPNHPYNYHEVLSGEWGSFALFYDGITTEPNAMFLTNKFLWPDWYLENEFFDIAFEAQVDNFYGQPSIQLVLSDVQFN
jgi:hypothetical protein